MSEAVPPASLSAGRAHVEIDLAALERNFDRVARAVTPSRVMPVVKADAYGHGAIEVVRTLAPRGAAGFLVARPEEGSDLRRAGIRAPILVGSPAPEETLPRVAADDLALAVSSLDQLQRLERFAVAHGWSPEVHLKVDTGMHRLGVAPEEVPAALAVLRGSNYLRWSGLMSHLADAELPGSERNAHQLRTFERIVESLSATERESVTVHLANSAGALRLPATRFDVVRPGYALYGGEIGGVDLGLEPVMSLKARVRQVQPVDAGEPVGYGGRWRAPRASRVGIVGVGYADGYPWRAGNEAEAIAAGVRVPVIGAVSMDLLAVDLTSTPVSEGDELTLLGGSGPAAIRARELAGWCGQSPYELFCHLRLRLPRLATRDGVVRAPERHEVEARR